MANPPHEQQYLSGFLNWLSSALTVDGKAILILPKEYLNKDKPSELVKILKRFECKHKESLKDKFLHTSTAQEIYILELSKAYTELVKITTMQADNNSLSEARDNIRETEKTTSKTKNMETKDMVQWIPLANIKPNPDNPRKKINEAELRELAQSIQRSGLLQAVTLREKDDYYEIVIGKRRCMACIMNGQSEIPTYVKDLSDIEVMEVALAENLLRKDLTAMEESNAFQKFLETGKYTIEDLTNTFGKTESFIRSRLRLQNLTDDFKAFLDNNTITLAVGLEISKYDGKTQVNIFNEHFKNEDNTCWRELGTKELTGRIERAYTTELSKYKFDKTECGNCLSNTGTHSLFTNPESGRCMNTQCLQTKRSEFTMSFCKVVADKYDNIDVCIAPYDKLDDTMTGNFDKQGIKIVTTLAESYPEASETPVREEFKSDEEYKAALEEHKIEVGSYNKEVDEIEEKVERGELKKVIYIGDNNPKLCYIPVKTDPEKDPLKALEEEDVLNKRNTANGVIKELSQLLQTCRLPLGGFTAFEEQMLIFFMLDSLNTKHYPIFGVKDANLRTLPDDMKYKISKGVTAEQKAIIQRDFLIRHLTKSVDSNSKSFLLIEFSRHHFLQESEDISRRYTDAYNAKLQRIKKQKEAIIGEVEA